MAAPPERTGSGAGLTASWLAARYGLDPVRIERLRRSGAVHSVRAADGGWRYPAWQFDDRGAVKPAVQRVLELARAGRLREGRIAELLERKVGLIDGVTIRELLLNGGEERALAELRRSLADARPS